MVLALPDGGSAHRSVLCRLPSQVDPAAECLADDSFCMNSFARDASRITARSAAFLVAIPHGAAEGRKLGSTADA